MSFFPPRTSPPCTFYTNSSSLLPQNLYHSNFPPPDRHHLSSSLFLSTTSQQVTHILPWEITTASPPKHQLRCSSSLTLPLPAANKKFAPQFKTIPPTLCMLRKFSTDEVTFQSSPVEFGHLKPDSLSTLRFFNMRSLFDIALSSLLSRVPGELGRRVILQPPVFLGVCTTGLTFPSVTYSAQGGMGGLIKIAGHMVFQVIRSK